METDLYKDSIVTDGKIEAFKKEMETDLLDSDDALEMARDKRFVSAKEMYDIFEANLNNQMGLSLIKTSKTSRKDVKLLGERAWVCSVEELTVPINEGYRTEYAELSADELIEVTALPSIESDWYIATSPETVPAFLVASRQNAGYSIEVISKEIRYSEDESVATVIIGAVEVEDDGISMVKEYCIICIRAITGEE